MDTAVEDQINREKMRALRRAVSRGRNTYEDDLDELASGLGNAARRSKIAEALYYNLYWSLKDDSIKDAFQTKIDEISWYTWRLNKETFMPDLILDEEEIIEGQVETVTENTTTEE